MPVRDDDPLARRILDAFRDVVATQTPIPGSRVYRRQTLDYSPDRDGKPAVVCSYTPERETGRADRLRDTEWTYPVSALLLDAKEVPTASANDPDWRAGWAAKLADRLKLARLRTTAEPPVVGVAETHWVTPDALTVLDLSAFDAAGLYRSSASFIVTVRTPFVRG